MENNIAEKNQKIDDFTPGFEDLEKRFEERTEAYDAQKKSIVGRCGTSHFTLHLLNFILFHTGVVMHKICTCLDT
jgi:hypothetical protein